MNEESLSESILMTDTFTPKTIKRFTSHENGTLYGSPTKAGMVRPDSKISTSQEQTRGILEL